MYDSLKCPKCLGPATLEGAGAWDGNEDALLALHCLADDCGWSAVWHWRDPHGAVRDGACLSYHDPRPRLPTPQEEKAHRERHGSKAGWLCKSLDIEGRPWRDAPAVVLRSMWPGPFVSYPHVDGRAVAWPEV